MATWTTIRSTAVGAGEKLTPFEPQGQFYAGLDNGINRDLMHSIYQDAF